MTAEFNEIGLRFLYPENWQLVRDDVTGWPRSVSVHGPNGAFWCVTEDERLTLPELTAQIVETLEREYEEAESHDVQRVVGGELTLAGVQLDFYCLDFLVSAQVLHGDGCGRRIVVLCQAETTDFDSLTPVFDAMTFSVLSNAKHATP